MNKILVLALIVFGLSSCAPITEFQEEVCPYWSLRLDDDKVGWVVVCRDTPNDTGRSTSFNSDIFLGE